MKKGKLGSKENVIMKSGFSEALSRLKSLIKMQIFHGFIASFYYETLPNFFLCMVMVVVV